MEVKAKTNLEKHLTANKFYRVIERTDKEFTIMNDSNIKYSYPRKAFEATAESQTKIVNPNTTVSDMPGSNAMWVASGTTLNEEYKKWLSTVSDPSFVLKVVHRIEDDEHLEREAKNSEEYVSRMKSQEESTQRIKDCMNRPHLEAQPNSLDLRVVYRKSDEIDVTPTTNRVDDTINNGGSTDYYKINPEWKDLQDLIEERELSYSQANILKCAFTFNLGRHEGTDAIRDLNKIIYFAQRELNRLKK